MVPRTYIKTGTQWLRGKNKGRGGGLGSCSARALPQPSFLLTPLTLTATSPVIYVVV